MIRSTRLSEPLIDESIRTVDRALDLGVTLIDTAESYGPYVSEELADRVVKGRRER